jgi:Ser-tRNA(Ala) deacylase AlaX
MTKMLYQEDSYMKQCDATLVSVKDDKYVVLDRTIFCPKGGGLPHDLGKIICPEDEFNVVYVGKFSGEVSHEVDHPGLTPSRQVHCVLEWERRNKLMRSHTASHTLASILWKDIGALVTGNQIELDKVRFDFNLENFDREIFQSIIAKANELFRRDVPVLWYELPREEALKIPGIVKMAEAFPPEVDRLRVVEIVGVDKQADGGPHVRNLREVGQIEFLKAENKGRNNRRVYFRLVP